MIILAVPIEFHFLIYNGDCRGLVFRSPLNLNARPEVISTSGIRFRPKKTVGYVLHLMSYGVILNYNTKQPIGLP